MILINFAKIILLENRLQNGKDRKTSEEITVIQATDDKQGDFPGGPVAKTQHFRCRGPRFDPWSKNY